MFDITYKGANCVVISTKKSTLVVDPKLSLVGLKDQSVKNLIEVATEERFRLESPEAQLIIDQPGEYEIGDFSVSGTSVLRHIDAPDAREQATMYRIEVGDVRIALLGNVAPKLSEDQYEALGVVDIVLLPVGGNGYTLDATSAAAIVRQIEPKVVVPLHYADNGLKYEVPQDDVSTFVQELGAPVETMDKYKLKSASALPAVLTVFQIERS